MMLLALIFRGVAFEFRYRDAEHRTFWDHAFNYGSVVGAFAQGIVLGAFIQGFQDGRPSFRRQFVRLLHAVLAADRPRPCVRLQPARRRLADFENRRRASELGAGAGRWALGGVLIGIAAVSLWTPFLKPEIAERWFSWPHIVISGAGADRHRARRLLGMAVAQQPLEAAPFLGAICLFVMSYLGIAISLWPMIVPYKFTLWQAASSRVDAGLPPRGHGVPAADHPHVHRLVLLGVSGQGPRRPRLSLSGDPSLLSRYSAGEADPSAIAATELRARAPAFSRPSERRCHNA